MDATLTYKYTFSLFQCPRSPNKWTRPLVPSSLMERNVSVFILKRKRTPPCPHLAPPLSQCPHSLMGHTLALIPPLLYTAFCRQEEVFFIPLQQSANTVDPMQKCKFNQKLHVPGLFQHVSTQTLPHHRPVKYKHRCEYRNNQRTDAKEKKRP